MAMMHDPTPGEHHGGILRRLNGSRIVSLSSPHDLSFDGYIVPLCKAKLQSAERAERGEAK